MGLELPGELVEALGWIGLDWPTADEEQLFRLGQQWLALAPQIQQVGADAGAAASAVWQGNSGPAVAAFQKYWTADGAPSSLNPAGDAAMVVGCGLIVYAAIILALKINFIVQLVVLTIEVIEAIATAVATFGASLLEIPIFQQITRTVVEGLIQQVTMEIIGG
ncbi:hypothetical protein [Actinoplanes sp. NPDC051851]|uniref:WXG100-like domain-containing protein n=1 Tax=Actinoplanes sp. NPDC051851 TaxID=3154753 RepID=UPI003430359D